MKDESGALGDVAKALVGGVNGTVQMNNAEQYVSVAASIREIKIALKIALKYTHED